MSQEQATPGGLDPDALITVCAECLQASCWQGKFMCDNSKNANIVEITVRSLRILQMENESYWAGSIAARPHPPASAALGADKPGATTPYDSFDAYWGDGFLLPTNLKDFARDVWSAACAHSRIRLSAELATPQAPVAPDDLEALKTELEEEQTARLSAEYALESWLEVHKDFVATWKAEPAPSPLPAAGPQEPQKRWPAGSLESASEATARLPAPLEGVETVLAEIDAAYNEVSAAVQRQFDGKTPLNISIPARPERDSDLIITRALRHAATAIKATATPFPLPAANLHRDQAWLEIQGAMEDNMLNPAQKCEFIASILKGILANPPKLGGYNEG